MNGPQKRKTRNLSAKSIPPSPVLRNLFRNYLDVIQTASPSFMIWLLRDSGDTYCQINGKISTKPFFISLNRHSSHPGRGWYTVQRSFRLYSTSRSRSSSARECTGCPEMPFTPPYTSAIFEASLTKRSGSNAIKSQHYSWMRWPFKWSGEPET